MSRGKERALRAGNVLSQRVSRFFLKEGTDAIGVESLSSNELRNDSLWGEHVARREVLSLSESIGIPRERGGGTRHEGETGPR